jgi:hypothetical protein
MELVDAKLDLRKLQYFQLSEFRLQDETVINQKELFDKLMI